MNASPPWVRGMTGEGWEGRWRVRRRRGAPAGRSVEKAEGHVEWQRKTRVFMAEARASLKLLFKRLE